jgi:hypothetical protein
MFDPLAKSLEFDPARKETTMRGFVDDKDMTEQNSDFPARPVHRKQLQFVLMSLKPGEEVHPDRDQFFRVEQREGEVSIDGHTTATLHALRTARTRRWHGARHKGDAMASKEHFAGQTTE